MITWKKDKWRIVFCFLLTIALGHWINFSNRKKPLTPFDSMIPDRPDFDRDMFYDFDDEEWRYLIRGAPRANEVKTKPMDEGDLQEYLEDHIPGYKEDTYWGEEYDLDGD